MSMLMPALYLSAVVPNVTIDIPTRSLSYTAASSQNLFMSGANFGTLNSKKWTCHIWFKRSSTGATQYIVHKVNGAATIQPINILFSSTDKIDIRIRDNAQTIIGRLVTTASYNDSNWHQMIVYWDTANATSADRLHLWVDGARVTSFTTNTQPSLSADMYDTTAADVYIGSNGGVANYFNGLLYQQAFFDNALPAAASLINGTSPVNVKGISGLYSLLHTNAADALEDDYVLSTNWTNTNAVTKSTTVPA